MRGLACCLGSLVLLTACTAATPGAGPEKRSTMPYSGPARDPLEAALRRGATPDLEIVYSDMHGLHGGETITIRGTGEGSAERRVHGGSPPQSREVKLQRADVERLIALLVEVEAWEQRVPERAPVPDESRAGLRIRAGGAAGSFWEWYNDMDKNKRLVRVKKLMEELVPE